MATITIYTIGYMVLLSNYIFIVYSISNIIIIIMFNNKTHVSNKTYMFPFVFSPALTVSSNSAAT